MEYKDFMDKVHFTDWRMRVDLTGYQMYIYVYTTFKGEFANSKYREHWLLNYATIKIQPEFNIPEWVELVVKAANQLWEYINQIYPQGLDIVEFI